MTWIKICGTTSLEDALLAVEAGADAVGFVFYEKSPRNIPPAIAREIVSKLPQELEKVGVFVNQSEDFIDAVIDETGITAVQMHGDKEDPHVAGLVVRRHRKVKILPAISMRHPNPPGWAMMWEAKIVQAFLVDSGSPVRFGGTGETFDWNRSAAVLDEIKKIGKVAIAGGLTPENVVEAMATLSPWGVDVVSGVEASPGKKDPGKVRAFVNAVREMDRKAS